MIHGVCGVGGRPAVLASALVALLAGLLLARQAVVSARDTI